MTQTWVWVLAWCYYVEQYTPTYLGKKNSVTQMSPLMIMSGYGPGKHTHTQAHIVSLDPCRIRSCLEQSWLRLGSQPELLQHVSGEREREATDLTDGKKHTGSPNTNTQFTPFTCRTRSVLAFSDHQCRCTERCAVATYSDFVIIIVNYFNNSAIFCG